ncbi:MAG: hypothetical protein EOM67_15315 [Spirochaetia bacterium]|nr:hypothetical protein [Spirochaetia bacterium]
MRANDSAEKAPSSVASSLTAAQKKALIADERTTFARAFDSTNGSGSRDLIWAANYAYKDLGMSKEEVIELLERINDYWVSPMDEERFNNTIRNYIMRW